MTKTGCHSATAWTRCIAGAVVALGVSATSLATSGPALADTKFIFAHTSPQEHFLHRVSEKFMGKLGELSQGTVDVAYHPGGDLGDWTVLFEQTMQGAIPMTLTWGATEFDPRLDISVLGYLVENWKKAGEVFAPSGSMIAVYDEIFNDLNMKMLAAVPTGFYGIAVRKGDGRVPNDLPGGCKGLKIRVPPIAAAVKRFEAFGCSPVPMPWSELYTALQLGTVDGRAFGPPAEIWLHRDVLETYVFTRDAFEYAFWLVNADWWKGLEAEEQGWVEKAVAHAMEYAWTEAENDENKTVAKLKDYGINVIDLTPEQLATARALVHKNEWPWFEKQIGKALMAKVKAAAGS